MRGRGVTRGAGHGKVRRQGVEGLDIGQPALFHRIRRKGRDGNGHILQAFGALLRGDDDFVNVVVGSDRQAGVQDQSHGASQGQARYR